MLSLLALAVFSALAVAFAAPALVVSVSGPSLVDNLDDFKLTTTVTNIGDGSLKILNDPLSPLTTLPTNLFHIVSQYGTMPRFIGIKAKYVRSAAHASRGTSAFTILAPGQSVGVAHAVSEMYDFSASGPGQYTVVLKKLNAFYHSSGGNLFALNTEAGNPYHTVNISGSAMERIRSTSDPEVEDCEGWQSHAIQGAIPLAQKYVANALAELAREGFNGADYKRWFGGVSETRLSTVASHFEALTGNNYSEYTYACNTKFCASQPGVFAYVYPNEFGKMHVCDQFFRAPVGGRDSRASTVVHESSHFTRNGGTQDHAYGEKLAQELARTFPQLAVMNADNHEYFATGAHGDDEGRVAAQHVQAYFDEGLLAA